MYVLFGFLFLHLLIFVLTIFNIKVVRNLIHLEIETRKKKKTKMESTSFFFFLAVVFAQLFDG